MDEDETALPAHGWAIIVAGVSEHGDIAGTPPIVAEAIELLPGYSVEDKTLARLAAMAAWTVCEINATISDSEIVALIPLSSNSDCDLFVIRRTRGHILKTEPYTVLRRHNRRFKHSKTG